MKIFPSQFSAPLSVNAIFFPPNKQNLNFRVPSSILGETALLCHTSVKRSTWCMDMDIQHGKTSVAGAAKKIEIRSVTYPDFFWADRYIHRTYEGAMKIWFVHPDILKMHSQALSVLRFLCKTFSKWFRFTWRNTLLRRWFLKNSYI